MACDYWPEEIDISVAAIIRFPSTLYGGWVAQNGRTLFSSIAIGCILIAGRLWLWSILSGVLVTADFKHVHRRSYHWTS